MSSQLSYVLTPMADADLEEIWRYTVDEWGKEQAVTYLGSLEASFEGLASGKLTSRPSPVEGEGLRYARCEHHFVFFIPAAPVQIIRVLHERMDFVKHL